MVFTPNNKIQVFTSVSQLFFGLKNTTNISVVLRAVANNKNCRALSKGARFRACALTSIILAIYVLKREGRGIFARSNPRLTPSKTQQASRFGNALHAVCQQERCLHGSAIYLQSFAQDKNFETFLYSRHRFELSIAKELRRLRNAQVVVLNQRHGRRSGVQMLWTVAEAYPWRSVGRSDNMVKVNVL